MKSYKRRGDVELNVPALMIVPTSEDSPVKSVYNFGDDHFSVVTEMDSISRSRASSFANANGSPLCSNHGSSLHPDAAKF